MEKAYDDILEKKRNGKFEHINDKFLDRIRNGQTQCSRMKLYLSSLFEDLKVKEAMKDEIEALVKAKKNICSIGFNLKI